MDGRLGTVAEELDSSSPDADVDVRRGEEERTKLDDARLTLPTELPSRQVSLFSIIDVVDDAVSVGSFSSVACRSRFFGCILL